MSYAYDNNGNLSSRSIPETKMALPWDYAEWPKLDESQEELEFAKRQEAECENGFEIDCASDEEWPEVIDGD